MPIGENKSSLKSLKVHCCKPMQKTKLSNDRPVAILQRLRILRETMTSCLQVLIEKEHVFSLGQKQQSGLHTAW